LAVGAGVGPASEIILARLRAGDVVVFGPRLPLEQACLSVDGERLGLNTIEALLLDSEGQVLISRYGEKVPCLRVPGAEVEGVALLLEVTNHLVQAVPYLSRRSVTGWPPGSIGDISTQIGYDVRELIVAGYSDDQIISVVSGRRTLDELLQIKPEGR